MTRSSRAGGKKSAARTRKAKDRNLGTTGRRTAPSAIRPKRSPASDLGKELEEAREQQAATSEVLEAINRSGFDLDEILQTLVSTAARLCKTGPADIFLLEGNVYRFRAGQNLTEPYLEHEKRAEIRAGLGTLVGRVALRKGVVQIADALEDIDYEDKEAASTNNLRSMLGVPLLRNGEPIGVFALARTRVEPFSKSQIRLVSTFANQAVIAIENARLFNETREALERQSATAEILKVISASPGELEPVFQAMLANAVRLCEAGFGVLYRYKDGAFEPAAMLNAPKPYSDFVWSRGRFLPQSGNTLDRLLQTRQVIEIVDELAEPFPTPAGKLGGARSLVAVPMLKEDSLIGGMAIYRQDVRPFGDKQIELVQNFAAQAVIAIENTRLLKELRERTDQVAELNRGLEARVAEQVEELGRVGRLKRFLAPQLAELIVSQGDEKILESHRREIVVVFCDLRGYTAFTETAEPEEVLDFLRKYHGALGPLVSQFEGTLDQFSGDGIMVFFNDPVPIPDPADRAVKMAVAMREAASSLTAAWRERGRELGFGTGIAQGYATLGQIGFSERSGYTAIGTVCNVAARLCGAAKDGQILLSQRVNVALKGSVATEQVGALDLKGLTHPVVAYNVPLAAAQPALRVIDGGNH
jgi:class 3 adenylate cyclase/putative methionine-R-sulfoxide reductase with GAF domain